jgi:hypothetical protein
MTRLREAHIDESSVFANAMDPKNMAGESCGYGDGALYVSAQLEGAQPKSM